MRVVIDACWVASAVWQLSLERNADLPGNRMLGSDGFSGRMLPRTLSIATALGAVLINDLADYRLQITKWPHKGGARNGAKLGSMGIIHHARLINIIIIVRRKRINLINNQT